MNNQLDYLERMKLIDQAVKKKKRLERLTWIIPRKGMSQDCQKMLEFSIDKYLEGYKPFQLDLSKRKKTFVKRLYKIIEQIEPEFFEKLREVSLEKVLDGTSIDLMGKPEDYKGLPAVFANKFFDYCMRSENLKEKLLETCHNFGIKREELIKKYEEKISSKEFDKALEVLDGSDLKKEFYRFVKKVYLNGTN